MPKKFKSEYVLPDGILNVEKNTVSEIEGLSSVDEFTMNAFSFEDAIGESEQVLTEDNYDFGINNLDYLWDAAARAYVERAKKLKFDASAYDAQKLEDGLYDNYFATAIAACLLKESGEDVGKLPVLSWAAFNKNSYAGFKSEVACLRLLLWAGFDVNAQDERGRTALHFMTSMKFEPFTHLRAVRLLLGAGCDPNIQNEAGDTALTYMCGAAQWNEDFIKTGVMLINQGDANPHIKSNDGETALTILKKYANGNEYKLKFIAAIEDATQRGKWQ